MTTTNKYKYSYTVLKYVHSEVLNENINIGVLVLNHKHSRIKFIYPKSLKRISGLYKGFNDWQLRTYLKSFEDKCIRLNKQIVLSTYNENLERLTTKEFIIKESSTTQFSKWSTFISNKDENYTYLSLRKIFLAHYDWYNNTQPNKEYMK